MVPRRQPIDINHKTPHAARIYDYLLGGTDNFPVDREAAQHAFAAYPGGLEAARLDVRINRAFLGRVVSYLAGEVGLHQYLDIGTGIPNPDNAHGVALKLSPESRVVYVDNDPIVLAHAHQILRDKPKDRTAFVDGDLRNPEGILAEAAEILDLSQPVGVLLIGILHVIPDEDDAYGIVRSLMDACASGSYLAVSQLTTDVEPANMSEVSKRLDEANGETNPPAFRTRPEVDRFFEGLELLEPGTVALNRWRPDESGPPGADDRATPLYGGVGRKP
jgi:hypothetical protein